MCIRDRAIPPAAARRCQSWPAAAQHTEAGGGDTALTVQAATSRQCRCAGAAPTVSAAAAGMKANPDQCRQRRDGSQPGQCRRRGANPGQCRRSRDESQPGQCRRRVANPGQCRRRDASTHGQVGCNCTRRL
eukprot:1533012-Prymnesium_polylepis.1